MRVLNFYKSLKFCLFGGLVCILLTGCNKEFPKNEASRTAIEESVSNNTPERLTESDTKVSGIVLTKRRIPSEKRSEDHTDNNALSAADQNNFEKIIDNLIEETNG